MIIEQRLIHFQAPQLIFRSFEERELCVPNVFIEIYIWYSATEHPKIISYYGNVLNSEISIKVQLKVIFTYICFYLEIFSIIFSILGNHFNFLIECVLNFLNYPSSSTTMTYTPSSSEIPRCSECSVFCMYNNIIELD